MLITEWNTEEAKEVWFEEGLEKGLEKIAQNMLRKGFSHEQTAELSELDIEKVRELSYTIQS